MRVLRGVSFLFCSCGFKGAGSSVVVSAEVLHPHFCFDAQPSVCSLPSYCTFIYVPPAPTSQLCLVFSTAPLQLYPFCSWPTLPFIFSDSRHPSLELSHPVLRCSLPRLPDKLPSDPLQSQYDSWLSLVDHLNIKAFVNLTLADSVRHGVQHLLFISGLGQCHLHHFV